LLDYLPTRPISSPWLGDRSQLQHSHQRQPRRVQRSPMSSYTTHPHVGCSDSRRFGRCRNGRYGFGQRRTDQLRLCVPVRRSPRPTWWSWTHPRSGRSDALRTRGSSFLIGDPSASGCRQLFGVPPCWRRLRS